MEILVIRHGQSEADILNRHEGRADFPLTELGLRQAALMADWVCQHHKPDIILSSPLKRARKTAETLGEKAGVAVEFLDALMEFNNGLLAGLPYEEANTRYPRPQAVMPHQSFYGQETLIEFRSRAEAVLSAVMHDYPQEKRVAVVSHGGMINMLFRSFLRLPVDSDFRINTGDTGVHLWVVENGARRIEFLNSTEHLKQEEGAR